MARRISPIPTRPAAPPSLAQLSHTLRDTFRNLRESIPVHRNRTGEVDPAERMDADAALEDIKLYTRKLEATLKSLQEGLDRKEAESEVARTRAAEQFHVVKLESGDSATTSWRKKIVKDFHKQHGRRTCYVCSNAGQDGYCKTFTPHFGPQKEKAKVQVHVARHLELEAGDEGRTVKSFATAMRKAGLQAA
tara:strand:+ start:76 stop:651 length:576 start_codon:yes stop_codon:yes gene_type:complete